MATALIVLSLVPLTGWAGQVSLAPAGVRGRSARTRAPRKLGAARTAASLASLRSRTRRAGYRSARSWRSLHCASRACTSRWPRSRSLSMCEYVIFAQPELLARNRVREPIEGLRARFLRRRRRPKNSEGKRFMFDYVPAVFRKQYAETEQEADAWYDDQANNRRPPELLPRDEVARAINSEVKAGRGSPPAASSSTSPPGCPPRRSARSCRRCTTSSRSWPTSTSRPSRWRSARPATT